ncbi:cysteine hydrolase family protein [Sedimentitalea sp. XS_ASV28]|uniref:cysteine hydrolase family protein n=1 Tax=Sedimentitalea sp. XS_ASV28 TaxID=3241296 RepID=UPI003515DB03
MSMDDWLLVIDMQPGFGDPASPWCVPTYEACAAKVGALVEAFSERVLFTRFVPPEEPEGAWVDYYRSHPFAREPGNAGLWDLDPRWSGRTSVASHRFSKWREAEAVLPAGAGLVICGVATDCCVLGTAIEATDAGRSARLVTDACAAGTAVLHDAALVLLADRAPVLTFSDTAQEVVASR